MKTHFSRIPAGLDRGSTSVVKRFGLKLSLVNVVSAVDPSRDKNRDQLLRQIRTRRDSFDIRLMMRDAFVIADAHIVDWLQHTVHEYRSTQSIIHNCMDD